MTITTIARLQSELESARQHIAVLEKQLELAGLPIEKPQSAGFLTMESARQDGALHYPSSDEIHSVLAMAKLGTLVFDFETESFNGSDLTNELFGWENRVHTLAELMPRLNPDDLPAMQVLLDSARAGKPMDGEFRVRVGELEKWLHIRGDIQLDDTGNPVVCRGFVQDISERKINAEKLRQSEAMYRLISENSMDVIWTMDLKTLKYTYFSPSVYHLRGVTAEQADGGDLQDSLSPDSYRSILKNFSARIQAYETGVDGTRTFTDEIELRHINGGFIPAEVVSTLLCDDDGRLTGVLGVSRNISERRSMEEKLKDSKDRSNALFQNLPFIGVIFQILRDETGEIVDLEICEINPVGVASLGSDKDEINGRRTTSQYSPKSIQPYLDVARKVSAAGAALQFETEFLPNGRNYLATVFSLGKDYYATISLDITDRIRVEKALRLSEDHLRRAQGVAHIGSWAIQLENNELQWSDQTYSILQQPLGKKVTYDDYFARIYPDDVQKVQDVWAQALLDGNFDIELRIVLDDGEVRWVRELAEFRYDENGKPQTAVGITQDITERKLSDAALRSSEEKYRGLLESLDNVIATVNYEGTFLYVNDVGAFRLGRPVEEIIQRSILELFPPPTAARQLGNIQKAILENRKILTETQIMVGGRMCWYRTSIQPIHDEAGQVIYALVNSTDIDKLKTTQQQLQELNHTLENRIQERTREVQDMYDNAPCGYHSLDANGLLNQVNSTEMRWLGYSEGEMLGKPFVQFLVPESVQLFSDEFKTFKSSGTINNLELELLCRDGRRLPVAMSASAIYDSHGKYINCRATIFDIRKRRKAQLALREREKLYRALFDHSNDGILLISPVDFQLQLNPRAKEMLGYKGVDAERPVMLPDIIPPVDWRDSMRKYNAVMRGETLPLFEKTFHTRQGGKLDVEINISTILDDRGNIFLVQCVLRDITLRKIIDEKLRFQSRLLEIVGQAIIATDLQGNITYWNRSAEALYGWSEQEALGKTIGELVVSESSKEAGEEIFLSLLQGKSWTGEFLVRNRFRGIFWAQVTDTPIFNAQEQMVGIIGASMDISERKKAEFALRESEKQNRLLIDESPDIIFLMDFERCFIRVNRSCVELTKYSEQTLIGKTAVELGLVTEEIHQTLIDKLNQSIRHGETYSTVEYPLTAADGSIRNVESRSFLLKIAGVDHVLVTSRDVSVRKIAEEALRLANAEMQRTLRLKDEFLANMSHELRTPLNAIIGISESMTEQISGPLNPKQLKYIRIINESGLHLLAMITDVLDLAKVGAGKITLEISDVKVQNACDASLRMIRELAQKKQQDVSFEAGNSPMYIRADERRLKQILVNLLSNAIKFTPEGGKLGLELHSDDIYNQLLFTVWDTGIGIKSEDQQFLFEPFIQLDASLVREQSGTGLGLALVSKMAQLHGGKVTLESEFGKGSRFTVNLPIQQKKRRWKKAGNASAEKEMAGAADEELAQPTLLVVDDQLNFASALQDLLEIEGYQVILSNNGLDGFEKAIQLKPDLVLLDIQLPGMDGFDAAKKIRAHPEISHVPIIAVTAQTMAGDRERCLAAGMDDYLSKPFTIQEFLAKIRVLLERSL